jgi:hypothetical protein
MNELMDKAPISGTLLLQQYFTPPRMSMDEMRQLAKEERQELADQVAALRGLIRRPDGKYE